MGQQSIECERMSTFPYFACTLVALCTEFAFHLYLNIRQLRVLHSSRSQEASVVSASATRAMQSRIVANGISFAETLAVYLFGLLPIAWKLSIALARSVLDTDGLPEYMSSISFVFIASAWEATNSTLRKIVVRAMDTRVGVRDVACIARGEVMGLVAITLISPPLCVCAVFLLNVSSSRMPLYLWLFIACLQFVLMATFPVFIEPMFVRFRPLSVGSLRSRVERLARSAGFHNPKIQVASGPYRGDRPSAHMYALGWCRRMVLTERLLHVCDEDQIVAIVAHELGHWKHAHTRTIMIVQQTVMLCQFGLYSLVRHSESFHAAFGFDTDSGASIVMLVIFLTMMGPIDKLVSWNVNALNRHFEFQADSFAARLDYAHDLSKALSCLDCYNGDRSSCDTMFARYHNSHPSTDDRIAALRAW